MRDDGSMAIPPSPLQKSCRLIFLEAGSGTIVTRTRDPAGTSASDSWRLDLDWAGLANYVDHGGEQVMRIMSGCKWRWPPQAGVHGAESVPRLRYVTLHVVTLRLYVHVARHRVRSCRTCSNASAMTTKARNILNKLAKDYCGPGTRA